MEFLARAIPTHERTATRDTGGPSVVSPDSDSQEHVDRRKQLSLLVQIFVSCSWLCRSQCHRLIRQDTCCPQCLGVRGRIFSAIWILCCLNIFLNC